MAGITDLAIGKITEAVPCGARGRLRVNFTINRQCPIFRWVRDGGTNLNGV